MSDYLALGAGLVIGWAVILGWSFGVIRSLWRSDRFIALLSPGDVAAAAGRQGIQAMPLYSPWGAGSSRRQFGASRGDPFVTVTVVSSVNLHGWSILARDLAPGSVVAGLGDQAFLGGDALIARKGSYAVQIAIQGFTGTSDQTKAFAVALAQPAIDRLP